MSWEDRPQIIKDVGFDFMWDSKKVWALNIPVEEMDMQDLIWHFDIPFWEAQDTDDYNLTPWEVMDDTEKHSTHYKKVQEADLKYPIDIMENKGRWLILDGLHRLVKAHMQGLKKVNVRKIPRGKISEITREIETVSFKPVEEVKELADKVFEEQKQVILSKLPFAEVNHIGSTVIPGSITKGDLDINVRVKKEDFHKSVEILKSMYDINQPDNWTENFASFKTNKLEIDFGLQLTVIGSKDDVYLKIRDVLRANPNLVEELNEIKKKYQGKSMDEYRKEKGIFFDKIVN